MRFGKTTTHVVVGDTPKHKWREALERQLPLLAETHLAAFLDSAAPAVMVEAAREDGSSVGALSDLISPDEASVKLGIEMMRSGGVPPGLVEELFLILQDTRLDKKLREVARRLFAQAAPTEVQDAVEQVLAGDLIKLARPNSIRA